MFVDARYERFRSLLQVFSLVQSTIQDFAPKICHLVMTILNSVFYETMSRELKSEFEFEFGNLESEKYLQTYSYNGCIGLLTDR